MGLIKNYRVNKETNRHTAKNITTVSPYAIELRTVTTLNCYCRLHHDGCR